MEEGIGNGGGLPTRAHRRLYRRWAEGGWGVIITGKQARRTHPNPTLRFA